MYEYDNKNIYIKKEYIKKSDDKSICYILIYITYLCSVNVSTLPVTDIVCIEVGMISTNI